MPGGGTKLTWDSDALQAPAWDSDALQAPAPQVEKMSSGTPHPPSEIFATFFSVKTSLIFFQK